jgi:hypothetical protein
MLEKTVERSVCRRALHELGVANIKLAAQGQTSWPDRLFLIPGGKPLLIEFKKVSEEPRPDQLQCHTILRMLGYNVEVHDDEHAAMLSIRKALDAARLSARRSAVSD